MEQDCIYSRSRYHYETDYAVIGVKLQFAWGGCRSNGKLSPKTSRKQLLEIIDDKRSKLIVTPIGGKVHLGEISN